MHFFCINFNVLYDVPCDRRNFYVNTLEFSCCNNYEESYAGTGYLRIFVESGGLPYEKDVVNSPCEEIATRLSGSLFLKWYYFKNPCPLTLRDAFLNARLLIFTCEILLKKWAGVRTRSSLDITVFKHKYFLELIYESI